MRIESDTHISERRTPFVLASFFLLGVAFAVYGDPSLIVFRDFRSLSGFPGESGDFLALFRWVGLLFFLGSSVVGFFVVPFVFFLRGFGLALFATSMFGNRSLLFPRLLFLAVPAWLSLLGLFLLGSLTFGSSRSVYDASRDRNSVWLPVSLDTALLSLLFLLLSVFIYRAVGLFIEI